MEISKLQILDMLYNLPKINKKFKGNSRYSRLDGTRTYKKVVVHWKCWYLVLRYHRSLTLRRITKVFKMQSFYGYANDSYKITLNSYRSVSFITKFSGKMFAKRSTFESDIQITIIRSIHHNHWKWSPWKRDFPKYSKPSSQQVCLNKN